MKGYVLDPSTAGEHDLGSALAEEAFVGGKRVRRKGHLISAEDFPILQQLDAPVHAVRFEPGDLHEDQAGLEIAQIVMGDGLERRGPVQSRYNLVATAKGVLHVDVARLARINALQGLAVFTLPDHLVVVPGRVCAGVKITPVGVPDSIVLEASTIAGKNRVVRVKPFVPKRVGVITTERMAEPVRERFRSMVSSKIGWYGSRITAFEEPPLEVGAVAAAMRSLIDGGAEVLLLAGGNTIDPMDPALLALPAIGAQMTRFGAPAHPGSMFWMAQCGEVALINLASCSMYSKSTVADLVLPWVFTGERVTTEQLDALGHGGLLDRGMGWRFPPYDVDSVIEGDEGDGS